ncbi:13195_t:CDS:1 [Ambispora gerdemannii]|uniref:13195_t:CDS:1 n=1 Tax=Ambispora gerdemannii TaxID=144530 RepID=A0A9N8WLY7_9GLOM|nr:13195_t:CDS:1 [Ambispora gerdemannii]
MSSLVLPNQEHRPPPSLTHLEVEDEELVWMNEDNTIISGTDDLGVYNELEARELDDTNDFFAAAETSAEVNQANALQYNDNHNMKSEDGLLSAQRKENHNEADEEQEDQPADNDLNQENSTTIPSEYAGDLSKDDIAENGAPIATTTSITIPTIIEPITNNNHVQNTEIVTIENGEIENGSVELTTRTTGENNITNNSAYNVDDVYGNEDFDMTSESEMPLPDTQEPDNDNDQDQNQGFGLGFARCILEYAGTKNKIAVRTQEKLIDFIMTLKNDLVPQEAHFQEAVITFRDPNDTGFQVSISQENYYAQQHCLHDILNLHYNFQMAKNIPPNYLHILLTLRDGFFSQLQRIKYSIMEVTRANSAGNLPNNPIVLDDNGDSDPGTLPDENENNEETLDNGEINDSEDDNVYNDSPSIIEDNEDEQSPLIEPVNNEDAQLPLTEPEESAGNFNVPLPHLATTKNTWTKNGLSNIYDDDDDLAPYSDIDESERDQDQGETEVPLEEINDAKYDDSNVAASHVESDQVYDEIYNVSTPPLEEEIDNHVYFSSSTEDVDDLPDFEEYPVKASIGKDAEDSANNLITESTTIDLKRGCEFLFTNEDTEESGGKKSRMN